MLHARVHCFLFLFAAHMFILAIAAEDELSQCPPGSQIQTSADGVDGISSQEGRPCVVNNQSDGTALPPSSSDSSEDIADETRK